MSGDLIFDAARVRAIRESLGLTRSRFAGVYGFTERAVHAWENGQRIPDTRKTLTALLQAEKDARRNGGKR